ncbi:MAG: 8-amino-7-oxononanoate synthase [Verrucomicrobiales bacterium]
MTDHDKAYCATLVELEAAHLRRQLTTLSGHEGKVDLEGNDGQRWHSFSSNDYLGMAHHPVVVEAAQKALFDHGVGSGSSRLIAGTHPKHVALEEALADFKGTEAALTFSTGYATAAGFATAFLDQRCIVLLDKLSHACLIDACRLSGAKMRVFRHNDLDKLESLLQWARLQAPKGRVVIMTESIFSMDGDRAPLQEIVALKEQYGVQLLVDEAHAVGVVGPQGRGLAADLDLTNQIDFHMGTLGKSIGVSGGYLAGSRAMIEVLFNRARSFIYSTAPPPAMAEAARVSLELIAGKDGDSRRAHVRGLMARLACGLGVSVPSAAILPLILGEETAALDKAEDLRRLGLHVPAIRYPTVARGAARLRITISATHEESQIDALTRAIIG